VIYLQEEEKTSNAKLKIENDSNAKFINVWSSHIRLLHTNEENLLMKEK